MRNEFAFLVPYVDVDEEEKAVRGAFSQGKLLVEDVLRGPGFVALSASSLNHLRSAVRIITRRGVVVGEDADTEDLFGFAQVALLSELARAASAQPLVGLLKTARGCADGCVALYRLIEDGRALPVSVNADRFGSQACVSALRARPEGGFTAEIGWPALSALGSPRLEVDLAFATPRLDRAQEPAVALRVVENGDWIRREAARVTSRISANAPFSARHALGVARAALALASGRSMDMQLAAYSEALGRVLKGSPEAEVVATTSGHIERGWSDAELASPEGEADASGEAPEADAVVIEPEPR